MFRIQSDLYFIIWEEFKKRNIKIPFPQQDIHVRSNVPWEQFAVENEYSDPDLGTYDEQQRTHELARLRRQAHKLGVTIVF